MDRGDVPQYQYEKRMACSDRVYHCELISIKALGTAASKMPQNIRAVSRSA